jgi:hypothetical protein
LKSMIKTIPPDDKITILHFTHLHPVAYFLYKNSTWFGMYCYTSKDILYFAWLFYTPAYGVGKKIVYGTWLLFFFTTVVL